MYIYAEVVDASSSFYDAPRQRVILRRCPHVELGVEQYYSRRNSTYSYGTRPTDPRTQAPTMYSSAAWTYSSIREYVHADVMLLHRIGISMFFQCFYDPPPYRRPGTAPFDPRSPSLALAPVLSPSTPRAAVRGGRGTVARPRRVGWRSGEPFQNGAF